MERIQNLESMLQKNSDRRLGAALVALPLQTQLATLLGDPVFSWVEVTKVVRLVRLPTSSLKEAGADTQLQFLFRIEDFADPRVRKLLWTDTTIVNIRMRWRLYALFSPGDTLC